MSLREAIAAVKAGLDSRPGAAAEPATVSNVLIYKVMGKMFAILSMRADASVSLKCDPHLAEILREQYAGVGHRYHLDRRHWINIELDAGVPAEEIERLAAHSYDLVCAKLTRKQKAELGQATRRVAS